MPTVKLLLADARLALADTQSPSLDARLLLQHATGLSHADVVAASEQNIAGEVVVQFQALVRRRALHEPVTRILGCREFYGRSFVVTPDVLDPRADTETIVDTCLKFQPQRILDLGTGSGILAITLLAELPMARAVAVDVSPAALAVAQRNGLNLGVADRLVFLVSDWFSAVEGRFDLIVSNPPYIPVGDVPQLEEEVRNFDPHLALVGGGDGLECYRCIAAGAASHLEPKGVIAVEIGAGQAVDVIRIFEAADYVLTEQVADLGGHIRCLAFRMLSQ